MTDASSSAVTDPAHSQAQRIALYGLIGLLSVAFLFSGGTKLIGTEQMLQTLAEINVPAWGARLIGLVEVAAVAALWHRRSRTLGLAALILTMAGAAGAHVAAGDPATQVLVVTAIAAVAGLTLIVDRGQDLVRFLVRG